MFQHGPGWLLAGQEIAAGFATSLLVLWNTHQPLAVADQARAVVRGEAAAPEQPEPGAVTTLPEEWETDRVTEGPDRETTLRALDEAVTEMGVRRAGYYDQATGFAVRVVNPTAQDTEIVERLQAQTRIPLRLDAVLLSDSWLNDASIRLDKDLTYAQAGIDLETGKLWAAVDREIAPEVENDDFAKQVYELVDIYLRDGVRDGAVAEGVTAEEAIDINEASFNPTDAREELPVKSGRWVNVQDVEEGGCTAGFLVFGNDVYRFTTAGHCFEGGVTTPSVEMANGANVGVMTQYRPDGWDIGNFSIPSGSQSNPAVTVNSSGGYRIVYAAGNPANGSQYCYTGRATVADGIPERCGTQNKTTVQQGKQLYCIERRTFDGDSGGPVYWLNDESQAAARGTMVGELTESFPPPANHWACYNRIGDVSASGNWSVVLWK